MPVIKITCSCTLIISFPFYIVYNTIFLSQFSNLSATVLEYENISNIMAITGILTQKMQQ